LVVCALRWSNACGSRERAFLAATGFLAIAIVAYEISWIIEPLLQDDLARYTDGLLKLVFVATKGRINLPAVTGAVALAVLLAVVMVKHCGSNAHGKWTSWATNGFGAAAQAVRLLRRAPTSAFLPCNGTDRFRARHDANLRAWKSKVG